MKKSANKNMGFSLLEVSIVLVVIGFIIGAVLFGQDMIQAAKIRALMTQTERLEAAINTFYSKYKNFPGDIAQSPSTSIIYPWQDFFNGLPAHTTVGGNGDGFISNLTTLPSAGVATVNLGAAAATPSEIALYCFQLNVLGLIDSNCNGNGGTATIGSNVITSKHGSGGLAVYTGFVNSYTTGATIGNIRHFFHIGFKDGVAASGDSIPTDDTFTPREAFMVDSKLDDGLPASGSVIPFGNSTSVEGNPTNGATGCVSDLTATGVYNISANAKKCQLRKTASF